MKDLDYREVTTLGVLAVLTILFGVFPKPVLDLSASSVAALVDNYQHAVGLVKAAGLP
jgi:NADH-quinone oxidoreductase subunit M